MADAKEKCIGKLTLDISDIETKIKAINTSLATLGKNADVKIKITDEVKKQIEAIYNDLQNSSKKITDVAQKTINEISKIGQTKVNKAAENKELQETVKHLREYYNLLKQAEQAGARGDNTNKKLFGDAALKELAQVKDELRAQAEAYQSVTKARQQYESAHNKSNVKFVQEELKVTEDAIKAYIKLEEAKSKVKQLEDQGKKDTAEYAKATKAVNDAQRAFDVYSDSVKTAAQESDKAKAVMADLAHVEESVANGAKNASYLDQVKQKYFELTDAIKRYKVEKNTQNADGMAMEQAKIDKIMEEVGLIQQAVAASDMEAKKKQEILNYIERCVTAEKQHNSAVGTTVTTTNELSTQVSGVVTRYFSLITIIRTINSLISNTVDYVSEYYDKMNEIQIITQASNAEVSQLSERYRQIAEDMNVSSLEMAEAAVYFTRQGLGAEEIENRLRNVTMYAKTANVEFTQASEIITAVVNSMGLMEQEAEDGRKAAQRVSDVFLIVGDNAATSGQEIGEAMQKAAASAGAFGVSFEWLASAIATVSETTRQEARTIGTAFNTIIARLHQIKQSGYNSDDETKINDIAKALKNIDVALMDQAGEWRDMEDVWMDVANKWSDLDGKTKSYIATTMAGVKQQNVFLAAMNDMSKSLEEGGRFAELYAKALDSAGTASEKYETWTDSVAAAQERLTIAQEKFYSVLQGDTIKSWYDTMANLVNVIAEGTEQFGGLNLILPITIGLITALIIAFTKLKAAAAEAGAASISSFMFNKHPVMMLITIVGTAITALTALGSALGQSKKKFEEASQAVTEFKNALEDARGIKSQFANMIEDIGDKVSLSNEDLETYNGLLERIATISPEAKDVVDKLRNGFIDQKVAVEQLNAEIDKYITNTQNLASLELLKKYNNYQTTSADITGYQNWDKGWFGGETGKAGFTNALRNAYQWSYNWDPKITLLQQDGTMMSKELFYQIEEWLDNNASWDTIATYVWGKMFSGDNTYDAVQAVANEVSRMITDVMSVVGQNMSAADSLALRTKLTGMLFNNDGTLRVQDVSEATEFIRQFVTTAIDSGFDPEKLMTVSERLTGLVSSIFGSMSSDMYAQVAEFANTNPDAVNQIAKAYEQLVGAGLSQVDIKEMLKETPIDEWADLYSNLIYETASAVEKNLRWHSEDFEFNIWDLFGENLENDVDMEALNLLDSLADAEISIEQIKDATKDVTSIEAFKDALRSLAKETGVELPESAKKFADYMKELKSAQGDIDDLAELIDKKKKGELISPNDFVDLLGSHRDIAAILNDVDALEKKLDELKQKRRELIKDSVLKSSDFIEMTPFADMTDEEGEKFSSLEEYRTYLEEIGESTDELDAYIEKCTNNMDTFEEQTKKSGTSLKDMKTDVENARKELDTLDSAIETLASGKQLKFDDLLDLATAHPEIISTIGELGDLKAALEMVRNTSIEEFGNKLEALMWKSPDIAKAAAAQNGWAGYVEGQTLEEYKATLEAGDETADSIVGFINAAVEALKNARKELDASTENWLEAQAQQIEQQQQLNYAKSEGFATQIGELQTALGSGDESGVQRAMEIWNSYDSAMKESIATTYPNLIKSLNNVRKAQEKTSDGTEDLTKASKELQNVLSRSEKYATAKYFKDSYTAVQKLAEGTISATDAYETFDKEVNKVTKAYEDILDVQAKLDYNAKDVNKKKPKDITASDVSNLASLIGMTADEILADFPAAVAVFDELTAAGGELESVLQDLNREAFIKITGASEADFSQIINGLVFVEDEADKAVQKLLATGQWTTEKIFTNGIQDVLENGEIVRKKLVGEYAVLKPASGNPFAGKSTVNPKPDQSSRRGGGGGGNNKDKNKNFRDTNVATEVERMLDLMSQVNTIQQSQQNYYQSQQKYYTQTGQLQGTIAYMQKEKEVLEAQNPVLEENIRRIEQYMEAKRAEIATLSTDDEAYKDVADDLDKLQKAHQNYTKQLIDNKTSIDALNKSMDEQRKKIRQMEIDLRNTILKAIEDREKKRTDMLNAEIEMENTILDLIKKRYERERDEIVETTNLKINALKEERDLLDEQLRIRKEQAEAEDKQLKLRELEAKYQRILADPTRRKEAQNIKAEIDELRKEMAWDLAEEEVKAQQDAIDQQITSLEDYVEYVQNYYEELFEHPQKLIAEMKVVISMTHDDMINWMKENDDAYKNSSENTQQQMVEGWNSTYNEMKGILETYWEEVEEIIARGDDYIIEFLKNNASEYAQAGKLQAEAYVDEWKKQLDDLHKAYQTVTAEVASNYQTIQQYTGSSSGSSSSSGGGGGGGGAGKSANTASTTTDKREEHGFDAMMNGKPFSGKGVQYATAEEARQRGLHYINQEANNMIKAGMNKDVVERLKYTAAQTMKYYKYGGMNTETGLAWLDGTEQLPERILSPHQTELFETMVEALDRMSRITVSSMPNFGGLQTTGANPVNVGDIIVNVDNLDTEDDYEELAEKVKQILMDEIGRAAVVGGLRIRST